jgi:hypothetical protein
VDGRVVPSVVVRGDLSSHTRILTKFAVQEANSPVKNRQAAEGFNFGVKGLN